MPTLPRGPYWMKTSTIRRTCGRRACRRSRRDRVRGRPRAWRRDGRRRGRSPRRPARSAVALTSARNCAGSPLASAVSRRSSRSATSRSTRSARRTGWRAEAGCAARDGADLDLAAARRGALRMEARRRRQHAEHERKGDEEQSPAGWTPGYSWWLSDQGDSITLNPRSKNLSSPRRDPNSGRSPLRPFHHQTP